MEVGSQKNQPCDESPTLTSKERRSGRELIINGQEFNPSCLHNGNFIKSLNKGVHRASKVVNASTFKEKGGLQTLQGQKLLCSGPFWTLPYVPPLRLYLSLVPLISLVLTSNKKCFPEFCELLQGITVPEEGIMGISNA